MYPLKLVTAPTELPLTLQAAKDHLRVDGATEDALITGYLKAAVQHVQNITNRQLMPATFQLTLDTLPSSLPLPRPPFAKIVSITAIDDAGQEAVFEESFYTLDATDYTTLRGVVGSDWYNTYSKTVIEYESGYESAAHVPEDILLAIKMLLTFFYENRGDANKPMPGAVDALLGSYRIISF